MIPIQNIYYMLSYAFDIDSLSQQGEKRIATEEFNNVAELCTAILAKGVSVLVKRGLGREYIEQTEALSALRGRIEISESIKTRTVYKNQLVCSYDDFSFDSYMNRIIKTTMLLLLHADISKSQKKGLRKLLIFFNDIGTLDVHSINWYIQYNRNNQIYRILISICYLVIKGLLQTTSNGTTHIMDFIDEQKMCHLYEKFIREYYRKEFKGRLSVSASHIPWIVDDGMKSMLPEMKSDIMLTNIKGDKTLIIDAKYYTHTTQVQFGTHKLHSNNLYQIFTYVKNKASEPSEQNHTISGMLLYAQTDEDILPNNTYQMSGNQISVKTLDLNKNFTEIAAQLNSIATEHFNAEEI